MPEMNDYGSAADAIAGASALIEATFLRVGKALEASVKVLTQLIESFEILLTELKSRNLEQALAGLAKAAAEVADIGQTRSTESGFARLQDLAEAIARRILKMHSSVKAVYSLGSSSRIAIADIRSDIIDFSTFADDIARTLDSAQSHLNGFAAELMPIRNRVAAAHETQLRCEKHQNEAAQSIPPRLLATIASIDDRHRRATRASMAVKQRSEGVRQEICLTIVALQIGDITRQRLEHLDRMLAVSSQIQPSSISAGQFETINLVALDARERGTFSTAMHVLQSSQLLDAAEAFDRDVRQIIASLKRLASDARAFRNLGNDTYGSLDRNRGTFIGGLEAQVGEALELLAGFGTAQVEADEVAASVSTVADGLCRHLTKVQSLEADIRIMSLNTTLKCSRVGSQGLALGLIAQELRGYAQGFAKEADALRNQVESMVEITGSVTQGRQKGTASIVAEVKRTMEDCLTVLRRIGQTLGHALEGLEHDGDDVVQLLEETVADLANHNEVSQSMRQAATNLAAMSAHQTLPIPGLTPQIEQLLDLMANNYTMASERHVHDRVLGRSSDTPPAAATAAGSDLEDALF